MQMSMKINYEGNPLLTGGVEYKNLGLVWYETVCGPNFFQPIEA